MEDIGYTHPEAFVDHDHFALRDNLAVNENIHRLAGKLVQLNDGSLSEIKYLPDFLGGTAKLH